MKILVASDPGSNPYLGCLICGLNGIPSVTSIMSGAGLFWMLPSDVDILHIQWPEVLFPGGRDPSDLELQRLEEQLLRWKQRTRIVATIHNRIPHRRKTAQAHKLFALIYKYCDGMVHMGARSVDAMKEDYSFSQRVLHEVIPHGNYACYENKVSRTEARRWLGIDDDKFLILAFGQLRHPGEVKYLLSGFWKFRQQKKALLIAGKLFWPNSRLVALYKKLNQVFRIPVLIHNNFVPDFYVQHFLNAADLLVICRLDSLNSGNIPLGFTFGKVVVGPDTGVMGELLVESGNPTFTPDCSQSLAVALEEAANLLSQGKGEQNRERALTEWSWSRIANLHADFYQRILALPDNEPSAKPG